MAVTQGYAEGGTKQTIAAMRLWTHLIRRGHSAFGASSPHPLSYPLKSIDFIAERSSVLDIQPYADRVIEVYRRDEHEYCPDLRAVRLPGEEVGIRLVLAPVFYYITYTIYPQTVFFIVECWGDAGKKRCRVAWSMDDAHATKISLATQINGWKVRRTKVPNDLRELIGPTRKGPV